MLSVVLATHNEESNLAACLDSIRDIADDIIVVDGESSDRTVAIAEEYQARVIQTTNKANFHINKQIAIDAAVGEVILQLDADEVLDPELKNFVQRITDAISPDVLKRYQPKAWWLKRKNLFLGQYLKKGGQYPDPVIRLFLRGYAHLPQKDVHEQMVVDGEIGWADGHLLHNSNPTFQDYLRKFNTYTSFAASQLHQEQIKISIFFTLNYVFLKPIKTFFTLYLRHRGYVDGFAGLVFAIMSGLHFPVTLLKLWELDQ